MTAGSASSGTHPVWRRIREGCRQQAHVAALVLTGDLREHHGVGDAAGRRLAHPPLRVALRDLREHGLVAEAPGGGDAHLERAVRPGDRRQERLTLHPLHHRCALPGLRVLGGQLGQNGLVGQLCHG